MDSEELVEKVEKNLEEELPDLNDIEMEKVKVGQNNRTYGVWRGIIKEFFPVSFWGGES